MAWYLTKYDQAFKTLGREVLLPVQDVVPDQTITPLYDQRTGVEMTPNCHSECLELIVEEL